MKQWLIKPIQTQLAFDLAKELSLHPLCAQLLINRGITTGEAASHFLFDTLADLPNPFLMKDMDRAVERILKALKGQEKIVIYGDYDVDGSCSTAMLILFFRELGYEVCHYIPHRIKEGYSLNIPALKQLKDGGCGLLITVDNGISAQAPCEFAREVGLDIIITDHHRPPTVLPMACAILNPLQGDCSFPAKEVCGTGIAFFLMMALRQRLREAAHFTGRREPNLRKYLEFVALATVADVVSLTGANRIFVRYGLESLKQSAWPGIKALKKVAQIEGEVESHHLGFRIGPRINAGGRLYDAANGVALLISDDEDQAIQRAMQLDAANEERRDVEKAIWAKAEALIQSGSPSSKVSHVLFDEAWHVGVVGIVASKLTDAHGKPAILFGRDRETLKGSARSPYFVDLMEVLRECAEHLLHFGGHRQAAGLALRPENLWAFQEAFEASVRQKMNTETPGGPLLWIDAELSLDEINMKIFHEIEKLKPHGQGNPQPLFCLKGVASANGRILKEKHLKFDLGSKKKIGAIAFGMAHHYPLPPSMDVAFALQCNTYRNQISLVLNIKDMKNFSASR